jgi:hypothetical protein
MPENFICCILQVRKILGILDRDGRIDRQGMQQFQVINSEYFFGTIAHVYYTKIVIVTLQRDAEHGFDFH